MENKELKILAVDDIYDNLITLKALILEAFPYAQVVFALSGQEAISITERMQPDLILLDVVMPDMDGFEVCKRLKADVNLMDIPVVFITALKGDKESRIKGLEVGAEAFLAKPVDESELVAQIRAMTKIREANLLRRNEQEQLSAIVSEKTMQLELNNVATLNLLEDLQKEIDARRKTETELLRSEARLRRAELASKSGNWEYNHETKIFHLSDGAAFVLGFSDTNIDYKTFVDLIAEKDRNEFKHSLNQLITNGLPFNSEIQFLPYGHTVAIDIRIFAVKEKEDQLVFGVLRNITEQKEAREKLIESEHKFRELMDNSPEGITIYVDGVIAYVNKEAMNAMRAKDKSELIGKSLFHFIHPDNVPLIIERMQFVALTPLNVALPSVEEKYIRLDGTEMFVEIKVMPILYDGKPAVQISGHDITEKKQAREEIEKNRKELKTIYDNAPVMMCVVNEKAEILFSNNALNTFIDDPDKLTANITTCGNVFGCINSMQNPKGCGHGTSCNNCGLRHALVDTFDTGLEHKSIDFQTTILRGNEHKKVALLASTSLIESEGEKRLLLCMHDITARREAQEALTKSETLLRTFIENIPFGIFARDLNNVGILENYKHINEFGSILGRTPDDYKLIDENVGVKWKDNNTRAFNGEVVNVEVEYNVNGKMIPFQQIVFPIKSENQIHGIAGININISDRIKYQNELLDYQIQLKEFAAHLQTVREEERVDLAREIHDDLGQILVAIKFDLGMLGVKSKKFIRDEAVEEFSKQFKRLEGYVNNTIKSARRIMTDLRPELLDMVGLVEAFKEHINAFNERQSINCEFINKTTGVDLPPEKAVALFRILQESLNNAAKYSEATKVTVELGSMDKTTYLDITDNGVGFDLSIKKRNDSYGLTGMKERAYLLDGKVDIWSEPGKGVKIKVEVPE
jgi:PAS domain S-box-containing protein